MSSENKQPIGAEEREKYINGIIYDKFFSFDSWEGQLKDALTEHLGYVKALFSNSPDQYATYSLLALGSIYSIDRDEGSARKHREMLLDLWTKDCQAVCGENVTNELTSTARMMVQKNVVCPAKCSVDIVVSCDENGKVSYTYRSVSIQNADGNTILLPAWQLVDIGYDKRWWMLHHHMQESQFPAEYTDEAAALSSIPYIERIDMDISDLLQDSEASEFEDSEEEIQPGETTDVTYENTLPSCYFWMPNAGATFGARYYPPRMLGELWARNNWY